MLTKLTVAGFSRELASESPAPGGGSVAALSGTLSAGLIAMVCRLTFGKEKYQAHESVIQKTLDRADTTRAELETLIGSDTEAFNRVMAAFKLPKDTGDRKSERDKAIQTAFCHAAEVPFSVMKCCLLLMELAGDIADCSNPNCASDLGVSVETAFAGLKGALMNVKINLPSIKDIGFSRNLDKESAAVFEKASALKSRLDSMIEAKLA